MHRALIALLLLVLCVLPADTKPMGYAGVQFGGTGDPLGFGLFKFRGNTVPMYCPATAQWIDFALPPFKSVLSITASPTGKVRIEHDGQRTFLPADVVWITQAIGPGASAINGAQIISPVDATHFDIPAKDYIGSATLGLIWGIVAGRLDFVEINSQPITGGVPNDTVMAVGVKFKDAACTVAQLVVGTHPYTSDFNDGYTILSPVDYPTPVSLVGLMYYSSRYPSGGPNTGFFLSWHNTQFNAMQQALQGSATAGTWTQLTMAGGIDSLEFLIGYDIPALTTFFHVTCNLAGPANVYVKVQVEVKDFGMSQSQWRSGGDYIGYKRHPCNGTTEQIGVSWGTYAAGNALVRVKAYLQTDAGNVSMNTGVPSLLQPWLPF